MSRRESIPTPLRLGLSGKTAVHEAVSASRSFAASADVDDATAARLAIVVEELVVNLYDHGGLGTEDRFELELFFGVQHLTLALVAPGHEFDPRVPRQSESSSGAGAGLKLVRAWSRWIEHDYVDGRNRVALTLPLGCF